MNESDIKRINELYHKQKEQGLTEEEKAEQALLRRNYLESIRKNMRGNLHNQIVRRKEKTYEVTCEVNICVSFAKMNCALK